MYDVCMYTYTQYIRILSYFQVRYCVARVIFHCCRLFSYAENRHKPSAPDSYYPVSTQYRNVKLFLFYGFYSPA